MLEYWTGCEKCDLGVLYRDKVVKPCKCAIERAELYFLRKAGVCEREIKFDPNLLSKENLIIATDISRFKYDDVYISGKIGGGKTTFSTVVLRAYYRERIEKWLDNRIVRCDRCGGQGCDYCSGEKVFARLSLNTVKLGAKTITGPELKKINLSNTVDREKKVTLDDLKTAKLLIIDEFQELLKTEFQQDELFDMIDHRYRSCLTTILISNHDSNSPEVEGKAARVVSRILHNGLELNFDKHNWRK